MQADIVGVIKKECGSSIGTNITEVDVCLDALEDMAVKNIIKKKKLVLRKELRGWPVQWWSWRRRRTPIGKV